MKREICKKCKHYIQHYALGTMSGVFRVHCGHCSHLLSNMNKRNCEYYEEAEKEQEKQTFEILREIYKLNGNAKYIIERLKLLKSMIKEIKNEKKHN